MKAVICPFCGVASDVPHDTQTGCIDALQAEIARTRRVLQRVTEPLPPPTTSEEEDSRTSDLHGGRRQPPAPRTLG